MVQKCRSRAACLNQMRQSKMAHYMRAAPMAGSRPGPAMIVRPTRRTIHVAQATSATSQGQATPTTRVAPPPVLHLHVSGDTTVSIPFSANGGRALQQSVNGLIQTFVDKQKAERPQRWPMLEFRCKGQEGTATADIDHFEIVCNPNAHASAFEAKAVITLRTKAGFKVSTETRIPTLQADVEAFVQSSQ